MYRKIISNIILNMPQQFDLARLANSSENFIQNDFALNLPDTYYCVFTFYLIVFTLRLHVL